MSSRVTYKSLIIVSPSSSVTFVSECYDYLISGKKIVLISGRLEKELWPPGDSVMVNGHFSRESDLKGLKGYLSTPLLSLVG